MTRVFRATIVVLIYYATIIQAYTYTALPDKRIMQQIAPYINYKERSWHVNGDPCIDAWPHVVCDDNGYINTIDLGTIQLNGN